MKEQSYNIPVGNECRLKVLFTNHGGDWVDVSYAENVRAYMGDSFRMFPIEVEVEGNSLVATLPADQKVGAYDVRFDFELDGRPVSCNCHHLVNRTTYGAPASEEVVAVISLFHGRTLYDGYKAGRNITIEGNVISAIVPKDLEERLKAVEGSTKSNTNRIKSIEDSVLEISSIIESDAGTYDWMPMPKTITYAGVPLHTGTYVSAKGDATYVACSTVHSHDHDLRGTTLMFFVFDLETDENNVNRIRYKRYYYDAYGEIDQVAPLYIKKAVHPDANALDVSWAINSSGVFIAVPEIFSFYGMGCHSGLCTVVDKEGNVFLAIVVCPQYHSFVGMENNYIIFRLYTDRSSDELVISYDSSLYEHEAPYYIRRAVHEAEMFDFTKDIHVFDEMDKIQMPKGFCFAGLPVVNGLGQDTEGNQKLVVAESPFRDLRDGTSQSIYTFDIVDDDPIIYISNPHKYSGDERERWMLIALGEWRP